MASVYRRCYRVPKGRARAGERRQARRHTVEFADHRGRARRLAAFEDRGASAELGRRLDRLADLRAGGEPVPDDLRHYVEGLPGRVRAKLARWGLLSQTAEAAKRALTEHVESYEQALRDGVASHKQKGRPATPVHVQKTGQRIRLLLKRMGAERFADVSSAAVGRALRQLETKGARTKGIGAKTRAHYFAGLFAFLAWAQREKLVTENPLRDAAKPDGTTEKRHARRAFEPDEVRRLLAAARPGPERFGMAGEARYWLYRLAVETGLRAGELRTLTRASVATGGPRPALTVAAAFAKSRRERTVPLKPDTAAELAEFLGAKLPAARVFRLPRPENIVRMLRGDLTAANVGYVDDAGRYADFHSLRATFATALIAAGVDLKTAQELLGHASSKMTLDVYAKVLRGSHENAIGRLPTYDRPAPQTARATGTDHSRAAAAGAGGNVGGDGGQKDPAGGHDGARVCTAGAGVTIAETIGKSRGLRGLAAHGKEGRLGLKGTPPRGFEPLSPA